MAQQETALAEQQGATLKKEIGLVTLVCLGAGGMIGSGIFALPATMAPYAGPSMLLAILLAGIVTLFLAMPYAELGSAFPLSGGPYSLPRLALGDQGGFVMGWGYFLYAFIGTGAIIQIFVVYLGYWIDGLADGQTLTWPGTFVAVAFLWLFTAINLFGVKWGGWFGVITAIGRLIPLVIFTLWGLTLFSPGNFTPFFFDGFEGTVIAVTLFFWSYTGFEGVVIPTGEVKQPSRTIPLAMILTMVIAIVVYLLIAFTFVGMIDWEDLGVPPGDWNAVGRLGSPLADISKSLGLPALAVIVVLGAIFATGGSGGDWVLFQGRIPFAMAKDKLFWRPMGRIHPRFGTPFDSLLFASTLTTVVLLLVKGFKSVALMASITALVPYAAAALSVPILRRTYADWKRPFRLPRATLVAALGFMFATWLVYWATWPWTLVGIVLMLAGFPMFLLVRRTGLEWQRNAWIAVYLTGVAVVSAIGDPTFDSGSSNFTNFAPRGWLRMPWDLVVLGLFALGMFAWAVRVNTQPDLPEIAVDLGELLEEARADAA